MTEFNLLDEPWIPVRGTDGSDREIGLLELYAEADDLRELAIAFPLEAVATLRMLIAILQSAIRGPMSVRGDKLSWLDQHADLSPQIGSYLERWRHRFGVFSVDRPFMQQPITDDVKPLTSAALQADRASGNNATLFDHRIDRRPEPLAPGAAIRAVLSTQLFQPGGGVSKPFNRTDSPATKCLLAWVEGETMWETLVLNAPVLEVDDDARPIWEREPDEPRREGSTPSGWLDRATWRSRAVQLIPDEDGMVRRCRVHQHLRVAEGALFDPFAPLRRREGEAPSVLRPAARKALWRDAEALLRGLVDPSHRTVVFEAMQVNEHRGGPPVPSLRVVGQVVNQAKVVDVYDARFPVSASLLADDERIELIGALVKAAEVGAEALRRGVNAYAAASGAKDGWDLAARWEAGYWAERSAPFRSRLHDLAGGGRSIQVLVETVLDPWRSDVRNAARAAYEASAEQAGRGARGPEAIAKGRSALERRLAKLPHDQGRHR